MLANLHTHTHFSDGSNPPEDYIKEAIDRGLVSIGFSDHSPLPFENTFAIPDERTAEYCDSISKLQRKYRGKIDVFLGMEVDFIPGVGHSPSWFQQHFSLDFLIGSIHLVKGSQNGDLWFIDGPHVETYDRGLNEIFDGDIRKAVSAYYRQMQELIVQYKPGVIGHFDKIKMHNKRRFFSEDEPWYRKLVDETLDLVLQSGCMVEVNTRGVYKKRGDTLFPGTDILKKIHALDIPVLVTSDAHKPQEVSQYLKDASRILYDIGFRSQMILTEAGWNEFPLH
jgi:histidinol-phosphatase (PHP family)